MQPVNRSYRRQKRRPSKKTQSQKVNAKKRWSDEPNEQPNLPNIVEYEELATRPTTPSTSASKIDRFIDTEIEQREKVGCNYYLVHRDVIPSVSKHIICEFCKKNNILVRFEENHGFCKKISLSCQDCQDNISQSYTSPRIVSSESTRSPFEINRLVVEAFISIGTGYAAMEKFCIQVGMQVMAQRSWENHLKGLLESSAKFKEEILKKSRQEVRRAHLDANSELNEEDTLEITVSIDGAWHKRGHTSMYGIVAVIDLLTGLVLDYELLSKYCHMCAMQSANLGEDTPEFIDWQEIHMATSECQKNFEDSSGSMEKIGAEVIFKRSITDCNMKYTTILSDGDAKTFMHLQEIDVYPGVQLTKEECVNHVAKRMGTALRTAVTECKGKGTTLGGRKEGALTEDKINKLTAYYRRAIVDNIPNVNKMSSAVMATLEHCSSTDAKPKHKLCPKGRESWCFYNKSKAKKEKTKPHAEMSLRLNQTVYEKIKPVYQRLSNKELLNRCAAGKTQNANESFHSVVWTKCPKGRFVSKNRLDYAVAKAVAEFNMGCATTLIVHSEVQETEQCEAAQSIAKTRDQRRKRKSAVQEETTAKRGRKKHQKKKATKNKQQPDYGAGMF